MIIVGVVTAAGIVAVAAEIDIALKKAVLHCVHDLADWRTAPLFKERVILGTFLSQYNLYIIPPIPSNVQTLVL